MGLGRPGRSDGYAWRLLSKTFLSKTVMGIKMRGKYYLLGFKNGKGYFLLDGSEKEVSMEKLSFVLK